MPTRVIVVGGALASGMARRVLEASRETEGGRPRVNSRRIRTHKTARQIRVFGRKNGPRKCETQAGRCSGNRRTWKSLPDGARRAWARRSRGGSGVADLQRGRKPWELLRSSPGVSGFLERKAPDYARVSFQLRTAFHPVVEGSREAEGLLGLQPGPKPSVPDQVTSSECSSVAERTAATAILLQKKTSARWSLSPPTRSISRHIASGENHRRGVPWDTSSSIA